MVKFKYNGSNENIIEAVFIANSIYGDVAAIVAERDKEFMNANTSPESIAKTMEKAGFTMTIKTYWYWRRGVYGYFNPSKPDNIYINTRSLPRSVPSLVATFYHEMMHALDSRSDTYYFNHGSNYYKPWKENTAPFFVDRVAEEIARGGEFSGEYEADNTKIKTMPWWQRILPWNWL